jgi:ankyrin repeat protein
VCVGGGRLACHEWAQGGVLCDAAQSAMSTSQELYRAARDGRVADIERLVAAGADVEALADDWTPLQRAASRGHVDAIAALLAAGARVNARSSDGWTPLMWAASNGRPDAVAALLAAGAELHWCKDNGNTALHEASVYGRLDIARTLLDAGAKCDVLNHAGRRPVDMVRWLAGCRVALGGH